MSDHQREIYHSENGDRWFLCRNEDGRVFVLHKANVSSGGAASRRRSDRVGRFRVCWQAVSSIFRYQEGLSGGANPLRQCRAREIHIYDDHLRPIDPRTVARETRLQEAEAAFRKFGSRLQAFANTETLAVFALRRLGYQPLDAGRGFIGLSNTIGEHGQARNDNRKLIERSLKAAD